MGIGTGYFESSAILTWIPVINLFFAFAIIFLERKNVTSTWAWLLVLVVLPAVGFLLYLLIGQNLRRQKLYRVRDITESRLIESVHLQANHLQHAEGLDAYRSLVHLNLVSNYSFLTQDNRVTIFASGHEKFESLLLEIREAKQHVHLLYYMIKRDRLGMKLLDLLIQKAHEGVEVKLIYDHVGSGGLSRRQFRRLTEAGGEVRPFFPSRIPYLNWRINFRNHRKVAVIDGRVGYVGGFNIGDEYLGLDKRFGHWRDTHLQIIGSAVYQLQGQFFLDWFAAAREEVRLDQKFFPKLEPAGKTSIQVVASGPNSELEYIRNGYLKLIYEAKASICLQTPYFIPDDDVLNALKIAALSGVEVRLMLPRKADHRLVQWASMSYLGELLKVGVRCFLYDRGFLHAKTIVVDGKVGVVGTANIDNRSFRLNFEISAFLYDEQQASKLQRLFEADLADCVELTYDLYERRSRAARILESLARLLSPLL
ncbi:cardiolipin synthase [Tumebacillus algifaecis]|uniref:Cardiolipin synthase n=1 Tax=Tumebacillus algifaecis TaxID=1214604 RepID=A0A223CXG7_9BACL|nr:cardiolipin synthase [Tumebacillus algifaecis]ASS74060.1 cardiolipin synthase [Tumebacillus algifaecis]